MNGEKRDWIKAYQIEDDAVETKEVIKSRRVARSSVNFEVDTQLLHNPPPVETDSVKMIRTNIAN